MRLICGILRLDGARAQDHLLRDMAAQMDVSRLRPSLHLWHDGPAGLAVLDFSAHGAPASALPRLGATTIAADVRLDEPLALGRVLGLAAPTAEDALLLAALERFGPSGLDQVLGDFALASWNAAAQRLVCARDTVGVRPLAYVHQPNRLFAFASLPTALHGAGIVPKTVDEEALLRLAVRHFRHDDSLITGIKRLPPAHYIAVSREGVSLVRYWHLDRAAAGTSRCSPEEAACELRRLVGQATACRLPQSGEVGAHLSGGLDSSAIAVLAARRLRQDGRRLHAYSFLDRQRDDLTLEDETAFVHAVLEQEGDLDWTPIRPPATVIGTGGIDADTMTSLGTDEPDHVVCSHAEQQGVGLVLSGWGGDEGATFNGRGALAELLLHGRWRRLVREVAALKRERRWTAAQIFRGEILPYLLPARVMAMARRMAAREQPAMQVSFDQVLSADARRRLAEFSDSTLRLVPDGRENRWRLMTSPHIAHRADTWAHLGARHGLAFAFPLLDRRVVEFALSLPSHLFIRGGFRRRPFRDAMADVLPEAVRWRHQKYQPFPNRMLDVMESKDELLSAIDVYGRHGSVCRLIDLARLRQLVEAFPSPARVRADLTGDGQATASRSQLVVLHTLRMAEYLARHSGE